MQIRISGKAIIRDAAGFLREAAPSEVLDAEEMALYQKFLDRQINSGKRLVDPSLCAPAVEGDGNLRLSDGEKLALEIEGIKRVLRHSGLDY